MPVSSRTYPGGPKPRRGIPHGWINRLQSVLLLAAMAGLLGLCGWLIAGLAGLVWLAGVGAIAVLLAARVSPRLVLRMFRARPLSPGEMPALQRLVAELAGRAGLDRPPEIYLIGSRAMNAFSVGGREQGAVTVTSGLLRALSMRELAGVMAHEISHLAHNDTRVMALADVMARLTRVMSLLGIGLLLLNLPLMAGGMAMPWSLVMLLTFAPTVVALLQLALSRRREFGADLEAARLSGDPRGLALALAKLERHQGAFWEDILAPGRRSPDPSLLRTHPKTEDRIERLMALEPGLSAQEWPDDTAPHYHSVPEVRRAPRWHRTGVWY